MRRFSFALISLTAALWAGCDDADRQPELYFLGDSLVEYWDVERDFPTHVCHNWGLAGCGARRIDTLSVADARADVIILVGTNDLGWERTPEQWADYYDQYTHMATTRGGRRTLLLPVLPCNDPDKTRRIERLNDTIRQRVALHPNVIYLDVYSEFVDGDGIKENLFADGLHLNRYGYRVVSDAIKKKL